jgi:hypothetical protein
MMTIFNKAELNWITLRRQAFESMRVRLELRYEQRSDREVLKRPEKQRISISTRKPRTLAGNRK